MAAVGPRNTHPDIRARISIHDQSAIDIREQLQLADQQQKALRSQQSYLSPIPVGLPHRAVLRKTRTLPHRTSLNDEIVSDPLPNPLKRSNSFNSLSTLHREADAAALSLYRGSPISAISPPCVGLGWKPSAEYEPQDPTPPPPPLRVQTLKEQRRYQKLVHKSLKKQEKERLRSQKEEDQLYRAFQAVESAVARGQKLPVRTKSTRSIASQVVKKLSLKRPLDRLTRHITKDKYDPPRVVDFDSKQEIQEYLNPIQDSESGGIAELPAELPQYTPFQDSTRTQDNEPPVLLENAPVSKEKEDVLIAKDDEEAPKPSRTNSRSMRCDHCQNPIRLDQVYYHCSICENGDRIVCSSCDQSGWSCRHEITLKVRSVSRMPTPRKEESTSLGRERSASEAQLYTTAAMSGLHIPEPSSEADQQVHHSLPGTMSTISPWAYNDILARQQPVTGPHEQNTRHASAVDHNKDVERRRLEQDLALRVKEVTLREQEAAMREQHASLREQQAALEVKQQLFTLQLRSALEKETSAGVGAQFEDHYQDKHVRSHANKRKASDRQSGVSPSNSVGAGQRSPHKHSPRPGPGQDPFEEDDEENGAGTPKKIKQELEAAQAPEKLFACPYCKFDKPRYSERNVHEKHYRGCASGYWPDISRLKQHLYRVHWRKLHCVRCYEQFDKRELLDKHSRAAQPCAVAECRFPEKFDDAQYNEIRRKRPAHSAEQVWYIIYSTLFPGQPQPTSPYADIVKTQADGEHSPCVPEQDAMDVLGEVFESRLNQQVESAEQAWLRAPAARDFIRQQLRASMVDVIQRLRQANSPSMSHPSLEISPDSAVPSEAARASSISLTPANSVPPSPVNGPGATNGPRSDTFLLPSHRHSFSRPLPARSAQRKLESYSFEALGQQPFENFSDLSMGTKSSVGAATDSENDQYDKESGSWTQGDERGLAISTDFDFAIQSTLTSAVTDQDGNVTPEGSKRCISAYKPVRLASMEPPSDQNAAIASGLKANHSNASSVDSGYGSRRPSMSQTSANHTTPSAAKRNGRPVQDKVKGKSRETVRPTSPVPESDINFNAFDISFEEFLNPHGDPCSWDNHDDMTLPGYL
ncbi:hypothetical protein LTR10_021369 [Elasticomyces elasticus]|uniref:C2H2-type domain-containing protein n=1 Tax=Exophiala sideris TaxID=1016849 RepID=A0ABR0JH21_9EURO|nr:hypothetical protein LTR10_021369 [Elasticomyces elasticus]KAK5033410.1 hypothetical protein LTS07_003713 [Exophiala sideris]KAK5042094.1 hypothetical protein LTR13_001900 [Exophiala sideris]KAK5063954.1 hypothetical protein LTR69_003721 [Exophiala sideris]KAK5185362.1 hypothetical protein LTR44_002351 [Eurotiomycetes sp. CCFEE 6388]